VARGAVRNALCIAVTTCNVGLIGLDCEIALTGNELVGSGTTVWVEAGSGLRRRPFSRSVAVTTDAILRPEVAQGQKEQS
jgi:hypothetical protein